MGRVFITGDTHGHLNIGKLSAKFFPVGRELTKRDYVIICGDFGLVFNNIQTAQENYWLKWLNGRPWTTLFVDGNHENHPKLAQLENCVKFGKDVGKLSPSIYHLRRGRVYEIHGKNFLAYGGALSIDKDLREDGISWWKEEIPSTEEFQLALTNSQQHKIDFIVAHTLPSVVQMLMGLGRFHDETAKQLDHITSTLEFDKYFCGHFHEDRSFDKYNILYNTVMEII